MENIDLYKNKNRNQKNLMSHETMVVLVVHKCVILMDKCVNLKLR